VSPLARIQLSDVAIPTETAAAIPRFVVRFQNSSITTDGTFADAVTLNAHPTRWLTFSRSNAIPRAIATAPMTTETIRASRTLAESVEAARETPGEDLASVPTNTRIGPASIQPLPDARVAPRGRRIHGWGFGFGDGLELAHGVGASRPVEEIAECPIDHKIERRHRFKAARSWKVDRGDFVPERAPGIARTTRRRTGRVPRRTSSRRRPRPVAHGSAHSIRRRSSSVNSLSTSSPDWAAWRMRANLDDIEE
jgi:hypothetical protein